MRSRNLVPLGLALALAFVNHAGGQASEFNNPPGVDIWCGKAYRATNASFDPGGQFVEPPYSAAPLLRLYARPRMTIYLASEPSGSLLVDAAVSHQVGDVLPPAVAAAVNQNQTAAASLSLEILLGSMVLRTASVELGSVDNEIALDMSAFAPDLGAYNVTVRAVLGGGCGGGNDTTFATTAELYRLPDPGWANSSVSRVDNLYGGLQAKRFSGDWEYIFPYTYYVQWSLYWDANLSTLSDFSSQGFNVIHIVPTGTLGDTPFPWSTFLPYLARADELGLWLHHDVLWTWDNLSGMAAQVTELRTHPSLLLYYQSDEPDGKGNPPWSPGVARETLRALDPYHVSSLALNCFDFHYAEYSAGGEVVLPDVYPVSTNTSFSTVYDTPCNATYGCCGCDDCAGSLKDVGARLDAFAHRDALLMDRAPRTHWFAPQAFGNETFWTRYPTAAEVVVMAVSAVCHGARGIVMWDYPTSADVWDATRALAPVMTGSAVRRFVLGAPRTQDLTVKGADRVDAAVWVGQDAAQAMVAVVNLNYEDVKGPVEVEIPLPEGVVLDTSAGYEVLWGDVGWELMSGGSLVVPDGLLGLQVSMLVVDLAREV